MLCRGDRRQETRRPSAVCGDADRLARRKRAWEEEEAFKAAERGPWRKKTGRRSVLDACAALPALRVRSSSDAPRPLDRFDGTEARPGIRQDREATAEL